MLSSAPLPELPKEAHLMALLADDCEAAFKAVYHQHRHRIYGVALRYLKSEELAQEVVQEVFLKLWLKRKELKTDAPLEAWLFTVAKNNTLNRLKRLATENKARAYLQHTGQRDENTTLDRIRGSECNRILHEALQSLSENQLKVYRLAREENLSHVQIAAHLNISRLTVKTHMSRALQHLKLYLSSRCC